MSRVGDVETDGQMLRLRQEAAERPAGGAAARSSSEPRRPPRVRPKGHHILPPSMLSNTRAWLFP